MHLMSLTVVDHRLANLPSTAMHCGGNFPYVGVEYLECLKLVYSVAIGFQETERRVRSRYLLTNDMPENYRIDRSSE